jgi:transcriptional regulator with GAF, ATPase, and Fis domain/tetratricopeptide (TPR) repeat protein
MHNLTHILDYELIQLLGKGTFSEVYQAKKANEVVAIKLMRPPSNIDAETLLSSLRYEFWALKDLSHPNIIRAKDFGQIADGRIYLIEEFLEGVALDAFCRQRKFTHCESALIDLLSGLSELNRWHIIHGDIKPANIMVTNPETHPVAKLLDFGLAHTALDTNPQTISGGTPSTMAPEVILGRKSDHRSDLYSLGVTLYESLTGKNPFVGKTADETAQAHLHLVPQPIGLIRHDMPPEFAALIHQMMAKNPADRPISAVKILSQIRKDRFILAPTPFIGRQNELKIALSSAETLLQGHKIAVIIKGNKGCGMSRFIREVFYQIVSQFPQCRDEIALVENPPIPQKKFLLIERLNAPADYQTTTLHLEPMDTLTIVEWLKKSFDLAEIPEAFVQKIQAYSKGRPRLIWELLQTLAEKNLLADASGRVTPSTLSLIDWQLVFPSEPKGSNTPDLTLLMQKARRRVRLRNLFDNDPLWHQLDEQLKKTKDEKQRLLQRATILTLKGEALIDSAKFEKAREALVSAEEIYKNTPSLKADELRVRNFLAYIMLRQGKAREAVNAFEKNLSEVKKLSPQERVMITNLDLGLAYLQAGDYPNAVLRLEEETALHKNFLTDPQQRDIALPRLTSALYNLAQSHAALGDFIKAQNIYQEVLGKARQMGDPAFILRAQNGLGNVLGKTNRWQEALKAYGEALEVALAVKDFSAAAAASQNRGALAKLQGLNDEAQRDLQDSLKYLSAMTTHYTYEKTLACRSHVELGALHTDLGHIELAREYLNQAWRMAEKDADLAGFRYWVLLARARFWLTQKDEDNFKQDLATLNFYADDDSKKKQVEALKSQQQKSLSDQMRQEKRLAPEIAAILRINHDLVGDMPLTELLRRILSYAIELSHAELGVILSVDAKGNFKTELSHNAPLNAELSEISLSVARHVLQKGKPVTAMDAPQEKEFNQYASVLALNLRSIIGLPISFRGRVLGILYLSHRFRPGVFNAAITSTLEVFANQAGLALINHELLEFHRQAQESMKNELEETRMDLKKSRERWRQLPETIRREMGGMAFVTNSPTILDILTQTERLAESNISILIHGETGTGKELLARHIHQASIKKSGPFMAINCGALPANLVESELFGYVKGAFTGADRDHVGLIEAASGGTLFLDEVADLPAETQVRLLRVLQEREVIRVGDRKARHVDIRVLAASHKPLQQKVSEGMFREDLYYRLAGFEVTLPALRERPEDIALLVDHFILSYQKETKRNRPERAGTTFLKLAETYLWPGNIRELKNVVHTACALCPGKIIGIEALPKYMSDRLKGVTVSVSQTGTKTTAAASNDWYTPGKTWSEHELLIYASSLLALDFNVPRVAMSLKVSIATLYKQLRENRIREEHESWKKRVLPYAEGLTYHEIRKKIFSGAAKRHPGHPYRAARELDVAPVTFYRWSKSGQGKKP